MVPAKKIFDSYYGGKNGNGVYHTIINHIRPHDVYMELFAGGGSVFLNKKPAEENIINDIDPEVYARWQSAGLDNITLYCGDAVTLLNNYAFDRDRRYCIYLDPPYPLGSRRSPLEVYRYEVLDAQHEELLKVVTKTARLQNVDILISTYENEMYARYLAEWTLVTFRAQTRQGPATEHLYMNYTNEAGSLHQYDYLGQGWIDRQRIRRKIQREIAKLRKLPAAERNAIIQAIVHDIT